MMWLRNRRRQVITHMDKRATRLNNNILKGWTSLQAKLMDNIMKTGTWNLSQQKMRRNTYMWRIIIFPIGKCRQSGLTQ
ncbi:hypothetical protein FGO68_gene16132 [Halteria grandinella]|uniref:Uncharacterized protein n=1 Tax=Halteria grandinella TaxID=5974 RepID=A0A8J8N8B7_HALGN|nr:hypothetical protein FGO68_gene16132 [Halteria grandinella]